MKKFILFPCLLFATAIMPLVSPAYGFPPFLKFWNKESRKPLIQEHFVAPAAAKFDLSQKSQRLSMGTSSIIRKNEGTTKSPWNRLSSMHLSLFKGNDHSENHMTLSINDTSAFSFTLDSGTDIADEQLEDPRTIDKRNENLNDSTSSMNLCNSTKSLHKSKRKEIDDIFEAIANQKEEPNLTTNSDIPLPSFNKTLQFWKKLEVEVNEE